MWKRIDNSAGLQMAIGFSPLAGINYVETSFLHLIAAKRQVSVPLRGLIMWKPIQAGVDYSQYAGFSPLAGINYVETPPSET